MGELSRLRTSASECLQKMIEQAQTLPKRSSF